MFFGLHSSIRQCSFDGKLQIIKEPAGFGGHNIIMARSIALTSTTTYKKHNYYNADEVVSILG